MSQRGPGQNERDEISLMELFRMFPNDAAAEKWLVEQRWPNGIACHHCGSVRVQTAAKHKTMPFRCRDCRKRFSVRTGTVMQASNLGLRVWVVAMYLMSTNLKGISSMKLHRELDLTQKAAWFLAHRLRDAWRVDGHPGLPFLGPLELDETHVGGKAKSMQRKRKKALGIADNPLANKTTVGGVRDRKRGKVKAAVVANTAPETLHGFGAHCAAPTAILYSEGGPAHAAWPRHHAVVDYGTDCEGRHNARGDDTIAQIAAIGRSAEGERLRYRDLTAHRHGNTATAS